MLRSLDVRLFLGHRMNRPNDVQQNLDIYPHSLKIVRITRNTAINAPEYCRNKCFIIDSGITLSFNNKVNCENTIFQFLNNNKDVSSKIIFHNDVCGSYSVNGDGVIIKYDLPVLGTSPVECTNDVLQQEVTILGQHESEC